MRVQDVQSVKRDAPFTGVRVKAGEYFQLFYPNETSGVKGLVNSLEKSAKLSKKHADSLREMLGADDIHLEESDEVITANADKHSWLYQNENFKTLKKVIRRATVLPEEIQKRLFSTMLQIKLKTINEVAPLERQIKDIQQKGIEEGQAYMDNFAKSFRNKT